MLQPGRGTRFIRQRIIILKPFLQHSTTCKQARPSFPLCLSLPPTSSAVAKHRRAISGQQAALEDLHSKRRDVLETAAMEQVALPVLVDGSQQAEDEEEDEDDGGG